MARSRSAGMQTNARVAVNLETDNAMRSVGSVGIRPMRMGDSLILDRIIAIFDMAYRCVAVDVVIGDICADYMPCAIDEFYLMRRTIVSQCRHWRKLPGGLQVAQDSAGFGRN